MLQWLQWWRKHNVHEFRRNDTLAKVLEAVNGRVIIIIKPQVGVDPCIFADSNKFSSPVREIVATLHSQDAKSSNSRTSVLDDQTHSMSQKAPLAAEARIWWGIRVSAYSCVCTSSKTLDEGIIYDNQHKRLCPLRNAQAVPGLPHVSFLLVDDADRSSLMDMLSFISGWISHSTDEVGLFCWV